MLDFEFAVLGISAAVGFRAALGLQFGGLRVCTVGLVGFGGFLGKLGPWVWYNIVYISDLRCLLGQVVVASCFGGIWCVLRCGADFTVIVFD